MIHHSTEVQAILTAKGYLFVKYNRTNTGVYYITPTNQLVCFDDYDLIALELFSQPINQA